MRLIPPRLPLIPVKMDGIKREDSPEHGLQQEEKQEQKTDLLEGAKGPGWLATKVGLFSKKDMELQLALERNKHLEKECRKMTGRLEKLEKTQEDLMSHSKTLSTENSTVKEEKRKIEKELQVTLERNKSLEKECREIRERLKKLERKQEDLMSHKETLSTENATLKEEKRKIEIDLQVTFEKNKSLEKECREIRERLEKLEQKQGELMSQRETLLVENITMKEEKRMREEERKRGIKQSENQSQSEEQQFLLSQLNDLIKSKEEEKAKVKELKQKQKDLKLREVQLQEKIKQCDQDKKQNEATKAEVLDIQRQLQSLNEGVQNAAKIEKVVEDRQKELWNMYENVDQVRSMYEHKIEELREEMTRLTSRENLKEVLKQANEDQSVMTSDVPVLLQKIRPFFVFCVNPLNVLVIIHAHGPGVLVEQDFQEIQCVTEQRGNILGASKLLTRLVQYQGWLSCIVKVLRDDRVRRSHVADKIEEAVVNLQSDEQDSSRSEVKIFLEEKKRQTSQVEMLQKSIESLKDEMQEKAKQHKNQMQCLTRDHEKKVQELRQKLEAQVQNLTEEIVQKNREKERADKYIEKLHEERQTQEVQVKKLTDEIIQKNKEKESSGIDIALCEEQAKLNTSQDETLPFTGFKAETRCALPHITPIENYSTVETNYGGHFNPKKGVYIVPQNGRYHVTFSTDHQESMLILRRERHTRLSKYRSQERDISGHKQPPFDESKGVREEKCECKLGKRDSLYLLGSPLSGKVDATVTFSVSYINK